MTRLQRIDAIVEYIFNAGRFKLRLPTENLYISFALAGIRCPQMAKKEGSIGRGPKDSEPFAEESVAFAKSVELAKLVDVIESKAQDKGHGRHHACKGAV